MTSILPFDELNNFVDRLKARFPDGKLPPQEEAKEEEEDIIDEMLDLFLLAYAMGNNVTNANLSSEWTPSLDEAMEVVDERISGKTWRERVEEYFAKARNGEIRISGPETAMPQREGISGSSEQSGQTETVESGGVSLEEAIIRIAETEMHRDANTAALDTAKKAGATSKTWITMLDDRVRDTHDYLEGVTVGIDEEFYTYSGDHAPAPGMFGVPEEDINCRCELLFS